MPIPRVTTAVLQDHSDEVWNLAWSHSGNYLASASRDNSTIIWRIGPEKDPLTRDYGTVHILSGDPYLAGQCVAWSPNDSILLTAGENSIKMWDVETGLCVRVLDHTDVTALAWLPDGSGFISGGLDRNIILWDADGMQRHSWGTSIYITDLAVSPDFIRLVAVGVCNATEHVRSTPPEPVTSASSGFRGVSRSLIIVYELATRQIQASIPIDGELTSVNTSHDSRYALISRTISSGLGDDAGDSDICLWDLSTEQIARNYIGQRQTHHIIRSCFGGVDDNFVASGSEDGKVYVWHRDTGMLLEALSGHGTGSVNSVAWNPRNARMLASCSDDHTIRIWETPPSDVIASSRSKGGSGE